MKQDDYRKNAAETVDLAHRATSLGDKGRLLALAEAWLNLADRSHRTGKRHARKSKEHPLIQAKFGRNQPDIE